MIFRAPDRSEPDPSVYIIFRADVIFREKRKRLKKSFEKKGKNVETVRLWFFSVKSPGLETGFHKTSVYNILTTDLNHNVKKQVNKTRTKTRSLSHLITNEKPPFKKKPIFKIINL